MNAASILAAVSKPLVIVESPAKARTIARFLGGDFVVESSVGHIRDLPRNAGEVPSAVRGEAWARMAVDVNGGFKPVYVVSAEKKQVVTRLKKAVRNASELYLATDEDREGESIAWHLAEVLSPSIPVKRMVFHEITRPAIEQAVANPRDIDRRLVDAQEARRILDRLYGYEVSPVLWKKVMPGLSAGRVQSVATRLVVERERERIRFRSASYWDIEATFEAEGASFGAALVALDGRRIATGKDFDPQGALVGDVIVLDEGAAHSLAEALTGVVVGVRTVDEKPWRRKPHPPFMTSTLQQEAARKLGFGAARTMRVAQSLYENGYITYMRTDSIQLSETAIAAARSQAAEMYGAEYVAQEARRWQSKVKNAQEAHEAIRPAGDSFRTPADVEDELRADEFRLYDLIWKRTVASEMADATGRSMQVRLGVRTSDGRDAEFAASGRTISFFGFLKAYVEGSDDPEAELEDQQKLLPPLAEGQQVAPIAYEPKGHETQPPARYTEASLVKTLEEMGIGRPSTYASILGTIEDRGYVFKKGSALVPSFKAFAVTALMEQHFTNLVDYAFTARMEDDLDAIASGKQEVEPWLRRFYFGNGEVGLHQMVNDRLADIDAAQVNSIPLGTAEDGIEIVARVGRYGPYLQAGDKRASIPEDLPPDELTVAKAVELLDAPSQDRVLGSDPESGEPVAARAGRYGPYVQIGDLDSGEKPSKTASLFTSMSLDSITLDEALKLLHGLPREIGAHPDDGEPILAQNGRYGPYIKHGSDTRSLDTEEQLFTLTLDEAVAKLREPKRGRGQRAQTPLRELGPDPASGKTIVVKEGRYGPYVTDGETNASLRKGDTAESVTTERAAELLAERRDRGPAPRKRATTKKATTKKATTKKATMKKKSPAKPAAKRTRKTEEASGGD